MGGTSQGVQLRKLDIATMQRQPEGVERTVQALLQVGCKLRFMLIIDDLRIIGKHAVQDLLSF